MKMSQVDVDKQDFFFASDAAGMEFITYRFANGNSVGGGAFSHFLSVPPANFMVKCDDM